MRYAIRQLTPEHLPYLIRLLQSDHEGINNFRQLTGFIPTENTLTRQLWNDPDYEPELVLGAFAGNNLIGFIVAVRRPWKIGRESTGFIKWIHVAPQMRRLGIGLQLLQKIETEMKSHGISELLYGSSAPRYFLPGVAAEDMTTQALLNKHGWKAGSDRINLTLHLNDTLPPIPPAPQNIKSTLITKDDQDNIKAFITEIFSESWQLETEPVFQQDNQAFGIIAHHKDKVVGFAAVNATNPDWFGPMGVSKPMQGRGIGRILLLKALHEALSRKASHLTIPWVNETFYNKCLGKLPRQIFIKYSKNLTT